ncbi:MAG: hypothetical protein NT049_01055 [Planctomycetota bacterium]|nr:hypothetical protein [Planctomycetota bacterium]
MNIADLAAEIGATLVVPGRDGSEIDRVYAGDRVSDLLNHAGRETLMVSNLPGAQLVRLAELMDLPAFCLVDGNMPEPSAAASAQEHGTAVLVSSVGLFETCGRIYRCLQQERCT